MSDKSNEKKVHGIYAEYDSVDKLLEVCNRVREAGYTKTDAFTPFPVHGIDKALGIKPTILPWIALGAGLTGTTIALIMQIWMNGYDYPYIISGKPYISLPAFIPVAFELTILLASFGTFFGMWGLNKLPRFSNPVFTDPRFDRVTDDKFFVFVDAKDDQYDAIGVRKLFEETGSEYVADVVDDDSSNKAPRFILIGWAATVALSIIPLLIVAKMRVTNSSSPRFHIFYDMDFSPARDAQQVTSLFKDNRAQRPDVAGTVARGQFDQDLDFMTGIQMDKLTAMDAPRAEMLVRFMTPQGDAEAKTNDASAPAVDNTPWVEKNPIALSPNVLERGQEMFNIYCAVCHGNSARGNGMVNRRAQKILSQQWVPPASLHDPAIYQDKYPDGKLFSTISNGIRKMPGYAGQIKVRDRWAIVAYVRALQKSQNASLDLIPSDRQAEVKERKAEVDQKLKEAAEAEKKRIEEAKKKAAAKAAE